MFTKGRHGGTWQKDFRNALNELKPAHFEPLEAVDVKQLNQLKVKWTLWAYGDRKESDRKIVFAQ